MGRSAMNKIVILPSVNMDPPSFSKPQWKIIRDFRPPSFTNRQARHVGFEIRLAFDNFLVRLFDPASPDPTALWQALAMTNNYEHTVQELDDMTSAQRKALVPPRNVLNYTTMKRDRVAQMARMARAHLRNEAPPHDLKPGDVDGVLWASGKVSVDLRGVNKHDDEFTLKVDIDLPPLSMATLEEEVRIRVHEYLEVFIENSPIKSVEVEGSMHFEGADLAGGNQRRMREVLMREASYFDIDGVKGLPNDPRDGQCVFNVLDYLYKNHAKACMKKKIKRDRLVAEFKRAYDIRQLGVDDIGKMNRLDPIPPGWDRSYDPLCHGVCTADLITVICVPNGIPLYAMDANGFCFEYYQPPKRHTNAKSIIYRIQGNHMHVDLDTKRFNCLSKALKATVPKAMAEVEKEDTPTRWTAQHILELKADKEPYVQVGMKVIPEGDVKLTMECQ